MNMNAKAKIKTPGDLAKALQCNASQVSRYLKRSDWPFSTKGPWTLADVVDIQRWRAATLKAGAPEKPKPSGVDEVLLLRRSKLTADIRKLDAQAARAELELLQASGELVSIEELKPILDRFSAVIRTAGRELVMKFGNDAIEILNEALDRLSDEIKTHFDPLHAKAVKARTEREARQSLTSVTTNPEPEPAKAGHRSSRGKSPRTSTPNPETP